MEKFRDSAELRRHGQSYVHRSVYLAIAVLFMGSGAADTFGRGEWIWSDLKEPAPKNRFTYFRKVVELERRPEEATLYFAADSNARLWINGRIVRRKVARYHEEKIRTEVIQAAPFLRSGRNVIVVLHHNWGNIITFQRTGNRHAGLYLDGAWVRTDSSWRWMQAPEMVEHDKQVVGVIKDERIRYPLIIDGRKMPELEIHAPDYDDSGWQKAVRVEKRPWPPAPEAVETPGQREYTVRPATVLAAGQVQRDRALSEEPLSMAEGIRLARCTPEKELTARLQGLIDGKAAEVKGRAGESIYVTFDFHRPVHGYPFLELAEAPAGVKIDWGYAEIYRSLYSGEIHVKETGWLNPEGVVGPGYADRYITRAGGQFVELPDERTARWLTLHLYFERDGAVVISDVGMVKSQYPIDVIGSFDCGHERIHQIVKLCLIHAEITMSDSYIDTPGREDGQWIEDARPRALLSARWFGDTRLRKFLIRTHAEGQGPDGNLHPFAPSNYPAYPAGYDWSVQWVAFLYDDYVWSGRTETIRRYWDNLVRYWEAVLALADEEGVWRTNHIFADIRVGIKLRQRHQSSGLVSPWIIERLRWSVEMARSIGENRQAQAWRAMADKMTRAFRKYHIVPADGGVPDHVADLYDDKAPAAPRGYSQAGQTVAVYAELLSKAQARASLNYAFPEPDGTPPPGVTRWNNPTYGYRVLKALSYADLTKRAIQHLLERYTPYLPGHPRNPKPLIMQGPYGGPLPEYWVSRKDLNLSTGQINSAQPRDETGSHGWGALPLLWFHEVLLGVTIAEPGGGLLHIAPQTGGLPYVQGHTVTPKGTVWVSWQPQYTRLEVVIPAKVKARVVPPSEGPGKKLKVIRAAGNTQRQENGCFEIQGQGRYLFRLY